MIHKNVATLWVRYTTLTHMHPGENINGIQNTANLVHYSMYQICGVLHGMCVFTRVHVCKWYVTCHQHHRKCHIYIMTMINKHVTTLPVCYPTPTYMRPGENTQDMQKPQIWYIWGFFFVAARYMVSCFGPLCGYTKRRRSR